MFHKYLAGVVTFIERYCSNDHFAVIFPNAQSSCGENIPNKDPQFLYFSDLFLCTFSQIC